MLQRAQAEGKTVIFSYLAKEHLQRGGRVLVFTHRRELLRQAGGTFEKFGIKPEPIQANSVPDLTKPFHVAMVETFNRRMEDYSLFLASRSMIIIDEAHLNTFTKIFPFISPETIVIGATATPYRKGKSLPGLNEFYQDMVQKVDTHHLISQGYLSRAKTYAVPVDLSLAKLTGEDYDLSQVYEENQMWHGVVENWKRICPGTKTILFSSNVENSKRVADEFNVNGFNAKHIDGTTPEAEREAILKWFDETPNAIVCNCGILNAGFDQADIETVILYRATTSLPLFLQMCGRGSRTAPNKTHFNILDFGNNVHRMDFWEAPRVWSLQKDESRTSKEDAGLIKICKNCSAVVPVSTKICPYCTTTFEKTPEEKKKEKVALLKLLSPTDIRNLAEIEDFEMLELFAEMKGYKRGWVFHQLKTEEDLKNYAKFKNYNPAWVKRQMEMRM